MKRCKYFFSFCYIFSSFLFFQLAANQQKEKISPFVEAVHHRYYLIARLQEAIDVLNTVNLKNQPIELYEMMSTLRKNWHDFELYRMTHDKTFEIDFIKKVLKALKVIFDDSSVKISNLKCSSSETLCNAIDTIIYHQKDPEKNLILLPEQKSIDTDMIIYRFYAIKRLKKAFTLLAWAHKRKISFKQNKNRQESDELFTVEWDRVESLIGSERIKQIFTEIVKTSSLKPLLIVWNECVHYRYVEDDKFLKDSMIILIGAYRNLIASNISNDDQKIKLNMQMNYIITLYQEVERYDIEELLDAIDHATNNLTVIVREIESSIPWYKRLYSWVLNIWFLE